MAVSWTEEQKKVISLRDRNILVSAAAGSGKTAVLVQRILSKILDKKNPVDIDRMLIMTFTRAAAGEMKERISRALEEALYEEPENEHLQRQMTLIHTAQITTIDGFCSYLIRNYFHLIGLDPGCRTAEEGELKLLKEDVLKELFEDFYSRSDEDFLNFVECYAPGKTDEGLKELVLKLYDTAMSNPYPLEWLGDCIKAYEIEDGKDLEKQEWFQALWESVIQVITQAEALFTQGLSVCQEPGGPYLYEDALQSDMLLIDELQFLCEKQDFDGMALALSALKFARLSAKKAEDVEEYKKEQVKKLREEGKGILKDLSERYFSETLKEAAETLLCCRKPVEILIRLTEEFMERFGERKREKNIIDFTDMEHFALRILVTKEDDDFTPSQAARELSEKYDEVLVDEYQDSNLVQEVLTNLVSGWVNQRKNIFMVGDVKQSIYRFRLARPELFMEKYKTYTTEEGKEQRIDLHKNFRSRGEVLGSVNYIFRQIMGEDLGGVAYDEAAALYPGAVFPEGQNPEFVKTEVLLIEKDSEELSEEAIDNEQELEALAIAHKIQEMKGKEQVLDKETGEYRPLEYGDIVILLRTATGWTETFGEVLSSQGIPSYTASKTGYFSATEVVTMLDYLRICDNPLQDIPLAGVLHSPVVGCTSQELGLLRAEHKEGMLFDAVCAWVGEERMENEEEAVLFQKLSCFLSLLANVRDMAEYTPVHQLIVYILEKTGYGNYAAALPDGEQRRANLSMLIEKAMDYEKTSYRGLFNFVRYIEKLQKFQVDYGEVNLSGAGEGSVQIMTIHKSKGLEFPVVFAAGMGKQFNFSDINAGLLIHHELGIGTDAILPEKRITSTTLYKQMLRRAILKESLGEELRVLYVALTRAKEKLIITGTIGKLEERIRGLSGFLKQDEEMLPVGTRMKAKTYWDYLLPALIRHRAMEPLLEEYGIFSNRRNPLYEGDCDFVIKKITAKDLVKEEVEIQAETEIRREVLENWDVSLEYNKEIKEELEKRFSFVYPYEFLREIPVKVSVSELNKRAHHDFYEKEENIVEEPEEEENPIVPEFIEKQEVYTGASRGTAYHRVMECIDYNRVSSVEEIKIQIKELLMQKKLKEKEAECVHPGDILAFATSSLGQRMKKASENRLLFREQPFVISREAGELNPDWKGESVLVQGIMDAYFMEDGELILVDYKTDKVRKGEEHILLERYRNQVLDYAEALSRAAGKPVKEAYIYSFGLGKEIEVE